MPKRTDLSSIMIIGAGPIVIGQACEFDYSGAQACKALRAEGYRIILVNSNPATIMTDPDLADATYVEPITPEMVEKIIAREKPDALLPTMGGQTALNTGLALARSGALDRHGVELIGARADVIEKAEDRQLFRDAMDKIGLRSPRSRVVQSLDEARTALDFVGLPAIIRPSFTLGGTGGGIAYNAQEFDTIVQGGLKASPTHEVLIEQSVLGWKEYEMEVVRDKADNCIIICAIENIDPMGVHTGDSMTVAPALTLTDKEYQLLRDASIATLREIGVETGGSNVQFGINPDNGDIVVIEMNPRVSRSSALASKATGFPIAKIAAKLAVGFTLDELQNDMTAPPAGENSDQRVIPASFEPTLDYVVTKIPRFAFEKFPGAEDYLTTSMKSVGEVMSIGRCFAESVQKALRSLETGLSGFDELTIEGAVDSNGQVDRDAVRAFLYRPTKDRLLAIAQAFRHGLSVADIFAVTKFDPWFLRQIEQIVQTEQDIQDQGLPTTRQGLHRLKRMGFSDARLGALTGLGEETVHARRQALNLHPVYKRIDSCAGEFPSRTPYLYSCYEGDGLRPAECEAEVSERTKIMILGGGPNRIGQGIEFDYCCVHAAYALSAAGYETIMVNCNPETVSTDYDTSDRLYFEPLVAEDVIEIARREQARGVLKGVIVQFGGQTPLKLSHALQSAGIPILGTTPDAIDLAEDRERFQRLLMDLDLRQPANGTATTREQAHSVSEKIGFPVVIRPSYVLGGRAMEIIHGPDQLDRYISSAVQVSGNNPVLIDSYLQNAIEIDVDALCDGTDVFIAGIMEHIEEAGIHSGDSACSLPPQSLDDDLLERLRSQTRQMALALNVVGLMNVQFAIKDGVIYVLEVNPRASRTVPFVAKATGHAIAKFAARIMAGEKLADLGPFPPAGDHIAVKESVFPFRRFPGVDVVLGPEMRSTGEVIGLDKEFDRAFLKAQMAAGADLPTSGCVFLSVKERDKTTMVTVARDLQDLGFTLMATTGTAQALTAAGLKVETVPKVREGRPNIVDAIKSRAVQVIINTTEGRKAISDSFDIRRSALDADIPYFTTANGACAMTRAITAKQRDDLTVMPLQDHFKTTDEK